MKCPVCNCPMKQSTYDYETAEDPETWYCSYMPCDCVCSYGASKAVWEELARTRKALETLQELITKLYLSGKITDEQLERYKKMLITALEQKEVK